MRLVGLAFKLAGALVLALKDELWPRREDELGCKSNSDIDRMR